MAKIEIAKTFSRFTQRAGELVNKSEKTEYPADTAELIKQVDSMKPWLTQLISATEAFVDITAASKVIDTFQKNREKTTTTDKLGASMDAIASQSETAAPNFAQALRTTAELHQNMGGARKQFNDQINTTFIDDLRNFMNTELDAANKAKMELETARLDLDANKSKLKNAKTEEQKAKCEATIRSDTELFNQKHASAVDIFRKTVKVFDELSVQLKDLVQAERDYYDSCSKTCQQYINRY